MRCPRSGQSRPPSVPLRTPSLCPRPSAAPSAAHRYLYISRISPTCDRVHPRAPLGGWGDDDDSAKSENPALDRNGDRRRNVDLGNGDVSKQGAKTRSYAVSRAWDCREALWLRILAHSQPLPLPRRGDNRPMAFLGPCQPARDGRRDLLTGPRSRALEATSPTGARKEKAPRLAPVGPGGGAIGKTGLSPRPAGLVRSSRLREPRTPSA
jgi:hypothetical protein